VTGDRQARLEDNCNDGLGFTTAYLTASRQRRGCRIFPIDLA